MVSASQRACCFAVLLCGQCRQSRAGRPRPRLALRAAAGLSFPSQRTPDAAARLAGSKRLTPAATARVFVGLKPAARALVRARYAGFRLGRTQYDADFSSKRLLFFIAGLALNLDLAHDEPTADRCGNCRRCVELATNAFTADRQRCRPLHLRVHDPNAAAPSCGNAPRRGHLGVRLRSLPEGAPGTRFAKTGEAFPLASEATLSLEES